MCRVLEVSRGGYYDWRKRRKYKRQIRNELLTEQVAETYVEFKGRYGAIRIKQELNAAGIACSVNYVAKVLQIQGLKARNGKGFKYDKHVNAMTNVADNVLKRNFSAKRPNKKWTTDITNIWVENQWFYLAVVMDLYSKRIVGWSLDNSMTEKIVINAIEMAFKRREIKSGLIVHSDRGVQYRARCYQDLLYKHQCRISMSRKSNCWDNAAMESFFSRLKVELVYAENFQTIEDLRAGLFEYIEIFYNRKRRHSALGYLCPNEYERLCA